MSNHQQSLPALLFLKQQQQTDGSFLDISDAPSLLVTALILDALTVLPSQSLLTDIQDKAAQYLLSAKDEDWLFPTPLGTTCLIFSALAKYKRELVEGKALASILLALTNHELQEGGPYYTNLPNKTSDSKSHLVDIGTNAAIAYFLKQYGVQLPSLNNFIEQRAKYNTLDSVELSAELVTRLISKLPLFSSWQNSVAAAEAGSTPVPKDQFKEVTKELPRIIMLAWQLEDEAKMYESRIEIPAHNSITEAEEKMLELIKCEARKRFSVLTDELKGLAVGQIEKSIAGNTNRQMSLMPLYLREALGEKGSIFSDVYIARLGLENILFWTAFIIYDDFWDKDEAARPHILPTANVYTREFIRFFSDILPSSVGFQDFFHRLMDKLDAANTWETLHCRTAISGVHFTVPPHLPDFGDYEKKYEPASAHILGSVVLFYQLGFAIDSWETKTLINYFRSYLIPMQINDDLHDWQEDLVRGHLSTVVTMLLEDLGPECREINLISDLSKLEQIFFSKTLPRAATVARTYLDKARTALYGLPIIKNRAPLERFIISIEESLEMALRERAFANDFLKNFKSSNDGVFLNNFL